MILKAKLVKGFSLVEIVAVMAITVLVISFAVYGIGLVQKKSRDSERASALGEIKVLITDFQSETGRLPQYGTEIAFVTNNVFLYYPSGKTELVDLRGSAKMKSINSTASVSDTSGSAYYYELKSDGYILGADKEDGSVLDMGTSRTKFADLITSP